MFTKLLFTLACATIGCAHVTTAQIITFNKDFGFTDGNGLWLDNAADIIQLIDSNSLLLSSSTGIQSKRGKIVFTKYSKFGSQLFEKSYGQDSTFYLSGGAGTLIKTFDDGFAIGGFGGISGESKGMLWKFTGEGDSIFMKEFGTLTRDTFDTFNDCVQLPDSGFVALGTSELNQDSFTVSQLNADIYLVRTNSLGNLIWEKRYGNSYVDQGYSIEKFGSEKLIIAGYKRAYAAVTDTPWIFVVDLEGNILKEMKITDSPYNCFYFIGPFLFSSIDGNFFFTGCLNGALQPGNFDYPEYVAKLDTNLNFVWQTNFNGPTEQYIYSVKQFQDSSVLVVGVQVDSINGKLMGWVCKLNQDGVVEWSKLYKHQTNSINYLYSIDQTYDCGYVVSGSTNGGDQQSWLLKMDKYGCINPVCDTTASSCGLGIPTGNAQSQSVSTLGLDASLYPNPASDILNVFYNLPEGTGSALLLVFDVSGRKMAAQKIYRGSHTVELNVSAWAQGLYVSVIKTATVKLTKKFFVGR